METLSGGRQTVKADFGFIQYSIAEHAHFMILDCCFEIDRPGCFMMDYREEKLLAVFSLKGAFSIRTNSIKILSAQGCGQILYSESGKIEFSFNRKQTYSSVLLLFSYPSIEQLAKVYLPVQQLFDSIFQRKDACLFIFPRIIPDGLIPSLSRIKKSNLLSHDLDSLGRQLLIFLRSELYEASKEYLGNSLSMDESHDEERFYKAVWLILQNPAARRSTKSLAQTIHVNEFRLKKIFKLKFKLSVFEFQEQIRMEKAKALLKEDNSIQDIAMQLGYSSLSHFSSVFKRRTGFRPTNFRKEKEPDGDKIIATRPV